MPPDMHLFIVCMNNSGSNLLDQVLGRCRNAVTLPMEGQLLPGIECYMPSPVTANVVRVWTEAADLFGEERSYDWPAIRQQWQAAWQQHPRYATARPRVLIEHSPPNVLRAALLQRAFPGARFLLMVRDPYAVAEGIQRRMGYDLERCVRHWIAATRCQRDNLSMLEHRVLFTYEEMCMSPEVVRDRIVALVPALDDLSFTGEFAAHSAVGAAPKRLQNFNELQIERLPPSAIERISSLLAPHTDLLGYFGYRLRAPTPTPS